MVLVVMAVVRVALEVLLAGVEVEEVAVVVRSATENGGDPKLQHPIAKIPTCFTCSRDSLYSTPYSGSFYRLRNHFRLSVIPFAKYNGIKN